MVTNFARFRACCFVALKTNCNRVRRLSGAETAFRFQLHLCMCAPKQPGSRTAQGRHVRRPMEDERHDESMWEADL